MCRWSKCEQAGGGWRWGYTWAASRGAARQDYGCVGPKRTKGEGVWVALKLVHMVLGDGLWGMLRRWRTGGPQGAGLESL